MKTDSTLRKFNSNFTQVPNSILNDVSLTLKAKGLFCYMLGKKDGWNFTIRSMSKQMKDGKAGIMSGLRELKDEGWLRYRKLPDGTGEYSLINKPNPENRNEPNPEKAMFRKSERISNTDLHSNTDKKETKAKKIIRTKEYLDSLKKTFKENLDLYRREHSDKYDSKLIREFYEYWTSLDYKKKIFKFETVQIFDIGRRLATWKRFGEKNKQKKNQDRL